MSHLRNTVVSLALLLTPVSAIAATPKEIDTAIKLGADYLKELYKGSSPKQISNLPIGIGAAALAGLALIECRAASSELSLKAITAAVRDAAFTVTQTYQIALCLLYLDRLGDPTDRLLIQMLGVRLLAGQGPTGGWTYDCIDSVSVLDERELRGAVIAAENRPSTGTASTTASKPGLNSTVSSVGSVGKLTTEIDRYRTRLIGIRAKGRIDDNSNTQFALLSLWAARKHGVPVDAALDQVEKRFLNSQTSSGGWPYIGASAGTPSMTCAGLLALATAIARRDELRGERKLGTDTKPDEKYTSDERDRAVQKALASLGSVLATANAGAINGKGPRFQLKGGTLGDRDLYFLWSVERVATLYGLDKIGGVDWYDVGAEELLAAQNISGSWGRGGRGAEVDTAFALLFLIRANLLEDLTNRLRRGFSIAELRSGANPPLGVAPAPGGGARPAVGVEPDESRRPNVTVIRPNAPKADDARVIADGLVGAMGQEWTTRLEQARDGKGKAFTQGLVQAIGQVDGDRLKQAREALAERLTRMTAETLRGMAKAEEVELRRGAILAMAMKDDPGFIADLINALEDDDRVVRAARAGLKSFTSQDFGPAASATATERKASIQAWRDWLAQQKK